MDTDMLAVIEDLLDSWPGTLIVVSHDRYFIERVTDQQYAILRGRLRHLPGGVDEYLRLRPAQAEAAASAPAARSGTAAAGLAAAGPSGGGLAPGSAAERAAKKELDRLDRQIARAAEREAKLHVELAANATDHARLIELGAQLTAAEAERGELEERWLEVASALDA
jgi:ATPase subunit of ABC transporter with duplicated ATPase domains